MPNGLYVLVSCSKNFSLARVSSSSARSCLFCSSKYPLWFSFENSQLPAENARALIVAEATKLVIFMSKERLSIIYHLVSTNSDKVRVGSTWGGKLGKRLETYERDSESGSDVTSKWIREVGSDTLRIIPMVVMVCDLDTLRKVEQASIDTYGCGLNPRRDFIPEEDRGVSLKWYHRSKESECKKRREIVTCRCGAPVTRNNMSRNIRFPAHLAWVIDID